MILTTKVTIGFKMPEEYELMQKFIQEHDIDEWIASTDTSFVSFTKTTCITTNVKDD